MIFKEWTRGQVVLDAGVSVCHGTVLACGDSARGHGKITVGSQTWIGQYNNLRSCVDSDIFIGANCLISQFCTLVSSNHKVEKGQPIMDQASDPCRLGIRLGDDVWLGAGVTILPGVSIGAGAVIAANSVVMGDVPENEIWAGSPAQAKGLRHGGVE